MCCSLEKLELLVVAVQKLSRACICCSPEAFKSLLLLQSRNFQELVLLQDSEA